MAAVLYGVVWSITEHECLPGGNLFGIITVLICSLIGGKLVGFVRLPRLPPLPPLLGRMPTFILSNIFFPNQSKKSVTDIPVGCKHFTLCMCVCVVRYVGSRSPSQEHPRGNRGCLH